MTYNLDHFSPTEYPSLEVAHAAAAAAAAPGVTDSLHSHPHENSDVKWIRQFDYRLYE